MALGVFGCMGLGLFQLRRIKKARFPDAESLQSGANAAHIDFWPGFRHFVAAQGGYILVAAATGAVAAVLAWDPALKMPLIDEATEFGEGTLIYPVSGTGGEYSGFSTFLWAFLWALPSMGLAGLLLLALGFGGVNLMPALDLTLKPATGESALLRFMKRKIPHVILMGIVLGVTVSVWRTDQLLVETIGDWISYWLKWTLGIGLVVAAYWKWGKLHQTVKNVRPLPAHIQMKLGHVMIFNMPLVAGLTLPAAFGILLVNGIPWLHVVWIAPLAGLGISLGLVAGYFRGKSDIIIMRFGEIVSSFPDILLIILLAATLRPRIISLAHYLEDTMGIKGLLSTGVADYLVIGIALLPLSWFGLMRLVRGQVLALREAEYVQASRAIGTPNIRNQRRTVS